MLTATIVIIFNGALLGFSLARLEFLDFYGIFCGDRPDGAAPGECFHWTRGYTRIGIMIHLFCIVPAGLLACFQFVPVIRHKAIIVHRVNGYIVLLLTLVAIVGK